MTLKTDSPLIRPHWPALLVIPGPPRSYFPTHYPQNPIECPNFRPTRVCCVGRAAEDLEDLVAEVDFWAEKGKS